ELLRNRSFEADSDPVDGLADYWGIIGGSSERRLCNLSGTIGRTGPCAFEFRGSATEDSRIQQRIPIASATFNAGDTLTLRGFVRAGGEPNFRLRIIVDYADGTADVGQVRVNTVSTNYVAFPDLALTLTKSNPIQIRVWVWSRSLSGRTYFDDLSLILTKPAPQGLIPMP
nr:hypothetical protein [Anaerolineae bacterium]